VEPFGGNPPELGGGDNHDGGCGPFGVDADTRRRGGASVDVPSRPGLLIPVVVHRDAEEPEVGTDSFPERKAMVSYGTGEHERVEVPHGGRHGAHGKPDLVCEAGEGFVCTFIGFSGRSTRMRRIFSGIPGSGTERGLVTGGSRLLLVGAERRRAIGAGNDPAGADSGERDILSHVTDDDRRG